MIVPSQKNYSNFNISKAIIFIPASFQTLLFESFLESNAAHFLAWHNHTLFILYNIYKYINISNIFNV